ncbi:MAG: 2'-5' RNA ligase family protein [Hymenobacteraceae bacterium]|nr:2'-5' RNA ligase family protein [Hymenobacteraceae bacterium]
MVAVTSLLDVDHTLLVNDLIYELEREFNLSAVQTTPYPHLTYLTTNVEKFSDLKDYLDDLSAKTTPFSVRTTGLGIFTGDNPIIYIPILRSPVLNQFHAKLYKEISAFSNEMGFYYNPDFWMPHITLALGDTNPLIMGSVLNYLNQYKFDWKITFDNLAILKKSGDKFLKEDVYTFSKSVVKTS